MEEKYVLFQNEVRNGFFVPALLKRAWNAEIGVLEFVDRVCKKHGIKYFADYGTLLGAVRHGGYIPWDDDIDIGMLRSDYNRFIDIMLNSPDEDYTIDCFKNKEDHTDYLIKVKTKGGISSDSEHMAKYGGFPFVAGIDIFVYDYLPKTVEGKKEIISDITYALETLNKMEECDLDDEYERIEQIEKKCSFRIDREKDLSNQIRQAIDNRLSLCREEDSDEIVIFAEWLKNIRLSYPKEIFKYFTDLKFESIDIPVLEKYEFILEKEFGEYIEIHMDNSAHDFPFYEHSINKLINNKENLPFFDLHRFEFQSEDIAREKCNKSDIKKEYYIEQYNLILGAMVSICKLLTQKEKDVFNELEKVQELAILFGNRIEISTLNNRDIIVINVETFCELLYELVLKVEDGAEDYQDEITKILGCMEKINELIKEGIFEDKERIAFIFEGKNDWEALEPLYQKEKSFKDKIVYAIPVPYFEYTESMEKGKLCFDFEEITEQNTFYDYRSFDFSKEYFDKIYYTNAYEIYDWGTFVAPIFFSKNLQKISPKIIFVQSFKVKDFTKDNQRMKYSVGDYARTPGVINADEIIVQSDVLRDRFVEILTEMSGTELEEVWKNKVKSLSCILGKASENNRNVPSEMVIKKVLYYINNSQVATYTELKKQQIKENLEYLAQKDVYLCVDEILKDCIKDNGYKSDFLRFINELTEKEKLHLIAENDVCPEDFDIYVGDRSSLTTVFLEKGIKVLLSPISIDQENYKDIIEMPD